MSVLDTTKEAARAAGVAASKAEQEHWLRSRSSPFSSKPYCAERKLTPTSGYEHHSFATKEEANDFVMGKVLAAFEQAYMDVLLKQYYLAWR